MANEKEPRITPAGLSAFLKGDMSNFLVASTPGGIEAQEAQGQRDFVKSETLPIESPWDKLDQLGIKQQKESIVGEDELFTPCTLPKDWVIVPTNHSMWSELRDEKGRARASIFYKAAFYDRSAFLRLNTRYRYSYYPKDMYKSDLSFKERDEGKWFGAVVDWDDSRIFETEHIDIPTSGTTEHYLALDRLSNEARDWIEQHYPEYRDELAYWD